MNCNFFNVRNCSSMVCQSKIPSSYCSAVKCYNRLQNYWPKTNARQVPYLSSALSCHLSTNKYIHEKLRNNAMARNELVLSISFIEILQDLYKILLHRCRIIFVNGPMLKCTTIRLNDKKKKIQYEIQEI